MARQTLATLRKIDTNKKLKNIISDQGLTIRQVADHCMVSYDTVAGWTCKSTSPRWRRMPNRMLALLESRLKG